MTVHGKTVCGGFAEAKAYVLRRSARQETAAARPTDPEKEWERLESAADAVGEMLGKCAGAAETDAEREILGVHRMMLGDEDFLASLREAAENGASAEQAVETTEAAFAQMFRDTGDEYLIARIDDIRGVCGRLRSFLAGETVTYDWEEPVVLAAEELLPEDLIGIGRAKLAGVVMRTGTVFSHTSILLREMGIPSLLCEEIGAIETGMPLLLDAGGGRLLIGADSREKAAFARAKRRGEAKETPLRRFPGTLCVNIGDPAEATDGLLAKCGGIGLFRTEYLYIGRQDLPDEEEQFAVYRSLLARAKGKRVTVRTFDLGSDKPAQALPLEKEENPALGLRGLRVYPLFPAVFRTQMRALLRAAVYGDLRILYPMVTSCAEIDEIGAVVSRIAEELEREGIPYRVPMQGAMIETPAAALLSDALAEKVGFFSIGTNDLTQYTLALDRRDGRLAASYDPSHRAILSLIRMTVRSAKKHGIGVCVCGELASDPALVRKWTALGIDSLSVAPSFL